MKVRSIIIIFLSIFLNSHAQIYLSEGFESGSKPTGWTDVPVVGSVIWRYRTGGYSTDTVHLYTRKPPTAHSGTYNAFFQKETIGPKTKLVTPPINLSGAKRPELTFWHAQYAWGPPTEFDKLRVYYKVHSDSAWHLIGSYLDLTEAWTQRSIFLPPTHLSSTYYLAFEGESNWGWGEVLDDIVVIERGIIPMNLKSFAFENSNITAVPSCEKNIPVSRIYFNVYGNAGQLLLDSLKFTSLNTDVADIENLGVKVFITSSPVFTPTTQIGSGANFSGGIAKFTNLNYTLTYGEKYIWLTYDIKDGAKYENVLDAKLNANSIGLHLDTADMGFDENLYPEGDSIIYIVGGVRSSAPIYYQVPASQISPVGEVKIYESILYDDFSTDKGWELNGDFERANPEGQGGTLGGYPDPVSAYSEPNVLGTDLSGLGDMPGDYENGVFSLYWAESPILDCRYYNDLHLIYKRWLNIESFDHATIEVSPDSGQTWEYAWYSLGNISEKSWETENIDLSALGIDRKAGVIARINMGPTDITDSRSGWNIDNFALAGNYIENDVGVTSLVSPESGCGHTNHDTVKVIIKNFGAENVTIPIPVTISINGGSTYVTDTLKSGIPFGDSVLFTFKPTLNLSLPAAYNTIVKTILNEDEDHSNDGLTTTLYCQPTINPSYFETFESSSGLWIPGGINSSWEWGIPEGSLNPIPSGTKVWCTELFGNYNNNEYSYIESPCFDFTSADRQLLKFSYWLSAELEQDGFNIYYSPDNGDNWELLDTNMNNWPWSWYDDTIGATGEIGWVGGDATWYNLMQLIPDDLSLAEKGKFRFVFQSDSFIVARGLAIDDFELVELPPDIGVSSIPIQDTCQYILPENPEVYIKNYGISTLNIGDTIIVGLDFNAELPFIDSFQLTQEMNPGDSLLYSFNELVDILSPGVYTITAYTLIEADPFFFFGNNDSASISFEIWQNPFTDMPDTVSTRNPDTLVLQSITDPNYTYYWYEERSGRSSTNSSFQVEVPGTVYYTVTDMTHGCQNFDSVFIELLFNDVGISSILSPQTACELGSAENIEVQIHNFGTDSLIIGEKILVYYQLNGGAVVTDSVILEVPLDSKTSRSFTFEEQTEDFSPEGEYDLVSWAYFGGDTIPENDSIFDTIFVYGYPTLDLGNDTTIRGFEYNLEVPVFPEYLWNDGNTEGTRLIDSSGYYALTVTDENGCSADDDITIWFKIHDIQSLALLSPVSSCNRTGPDPVRVRIRNNGSDTILASEVIMASYSINSGSPVTTGVGHSQMLPGAYVDHTFPGTVNLIPEGSYQFMVTARVTGDIRTGNDTLETLIVTNPIPQIDLDVDEDSTYYQTELVLDAGYDPNWTYLWNGEWPYQTYVVTDRGYVGVVVTDTITGCYGGDTVFIDLDILDYMVTSIGIDANTCGGVYNDLPVYILNNGNMIRQSANINLVYYKGGEYLFTEAYSSSTSWQPGQSRTYTTSGAIDLQTTGNEIVEIEISTIGDLRPENDNFSRNINVMAHPEVDFGGTSLEVTFPYELDAGAGNAEYLWSDGSDDQTLTVTETGTYSVTVTGTNGCETMVSVYLSTELAVSELARETMTVNIYPNPTSDYVTIEAAFGIPGTYTLELFNSQDMMIRQKEITGTEYKEEMPVGDLPPGVYFIRIRNDAMYYVRGMVIR